MSSSPAFCLNCQMELILDEGLYDKAESECEIVSLPMNAQAGRVVCGKAGSLPGQSGKLYEIICNSSSALKGPMCGDCTEDLLSGMDQQLKGLEEECGSYRKLLDALKNSPSAHSFDPEAANTRLRALKKEQTALDEELKKLRLEENSLNEELNRKKKELSSVVMEEEEAWKKFRDNHRKLLELESEEQNTEAQLACAKIQLEKLSRANVLNIAFHIWKNGDFGTINGFKLGRLPHSQVEWPEINAAWGQASLLLTVLMKGVSGFRLRDYEIFPMGNHSFIRVTKTGEDLPLYGSGGFKPFGQVKVDDGICAFLECFCQLQKHIESSSEFRFPYRMQRDRIEDKKVEYSVKMQFNSEERWTKAMKFLLTNLRWAISFVTPQSGMCSRE